MYVKLLALVAIAALYLGITACSSPNTVTRIEGTQAPSESGRYSNFYPRDEITYPFTCEENCYPAHPDVDCESPAEHCLFTGDQPQLDLDTGYEVMWVGHATLFVKTPGGDSFLFDPVSGEFDWPINWGFELTGGRARTNPQWISDAEQENLTGVLYSHLHYDHFNKADIEKLGNGPRYFTPLGMSDHFPSSDLDITEMAWFNETKTGSTKIHAVPAHHFNSRTQVPFFYEDDNKVAWSAWLLESDGKTLFFAGDTGYSPHFKDIQKTYGDIDVCLMPIASYHHEEHGEWYRNVHTTPEDALIASEELGCKVMVPWGYGDSSWGMGDKSTHAPLLRLLHTQAELSSSVPLHILNEGESAQF